MQNQSINYNPDVLSCLANLSNDEVFTPPAIANAMLDLLPQEYFSDPNRTFLDPATKTGVFLREIAKRLLIGLEPIIPDLEQRVNHILTKQLFGLGITELTAQLTRRSLYCSREANGKYSVCDVFENTQGNIFYQKIQHHWENGKCSQCGASQAVYDRGETLESHAYSFIHQPIQQLIPNCPMNFDVIIGNPPYQLNDGGGTGSSAIPIYQYFVEQAKTLNPKYISMIIPARWYTGGRGLDQFRENMLNEKKLLELHDFSNSNDCFSGVEIKGGICYFLWDRNYQGNCKVVTHSGNQIISEMKRELKITNTDIFIRYNESIEILDKVAKLNEPSFSDLISSNDPFGFDVRVKGSYKRVKPNYRKHEFIGSCLFYYNGWKKEGVGYIEKLSISKNRDWLDKYKILIPKAWGIGEPKTDRLSPFIVEPNSCCTETYLVINPTDNKSECENIISYINTKFFHFMVSLIKNTQNTMQKAYQFVPTQDFSKPWTDQELYQKYQLTQAEIDYIESMVRPME